MTSASVTPTSRRAAAAFSGMGIRPVCTSHAVSATPANFAAHGQADLDPADTDSACAEPSCGSETPARLKI